MCIRGCRWPCGAGVWVSTAYAGQLWQKGAGLQRCKGIKQYRGEVVALVGLAGHTVVVQRADNGRGIRNDGLPYGLRFQRKAVHLRPGERGAGAMLLARPWAR